ncbi:hypothetical protein CRG98_007282 [Punica granatum]|uniref:Integrase catalytic domain-containing protein n=1 Tax=Punica granatum TaxID=22663 RepID=A0A2I0KV10_PUNGR|nr:hypothetical protein CRG98_007282 [Punica granatum]
MDIIREVNLASSMQHVYNLVATDYFTKWVEAKPYKSINQKDVNQFIKEMIISRSGLPQTITLDQATVFTGDEIQEFANTFGIKLVHLSAYYPQANGLDAVLPSEVVAESFRVVFQDLLSEQEHREVVISELANLDVKRCHRSIVHGLESFRRSDRPRSLLDPATSAMRLLPTTRALSPTSNEATSARSSILSPSDNHQRIGGLQVLYKLFPSLSIHNHLTDSFSPLSLLHPRALNPLQFIVDLSSWSCRFLSFHFVSLIFFFSDASINTGLAETSSPPRSEVVSSREVILIVVLLASDSFVEQSYAAVSCCTVRKKRNQIAYSHGFQLSLSLSLG